MNKKNIPKLINLIQEIIEIIKLSICDTTYTEWKDSTEVLNYFDQVIKKLELNDISVIHELKIIFGPTGSLQDLSISSGWGDKYIELSKVFDNLILDKKYFLLILAKYLKIFP